MNDSIKLGLLINSILLAALAVMAGHYIRSHSMQTAHAIGGGWETHGVVLIPSKGSHERLVLVDTLRKTICVYKQRGTGDFTISAARNYLYDLELNDSEGKLDKGWTYMDARNAYETAHGRQP